MNSPPVFNGRYVNIDGLVLATTLFPRSWQGPFVGSFLCSGRYFSIKVFFFPSLQLLRGKPLARFSLDQLMDSLEIPAAGRHPT